MIEVNESSIDKINMYLESEARGKIAKLLFERFEEQFITMNDAEKFVVQASEEMKRYPHLDRKEFSYWCFLAATMQNQQFHLEESMHAYLKEDHFQGQVKTLYRFVSDQIMQTTQM